MNKIKKKYNINYDEIVGTLIDEWCWFQVVCYILWIVNYFINKKSCLLINVVQSFNKDK
jgi:hypothetical protein